MKRDNEDSVHRADRNAHRVLFASMILAILAVPGFLAWCYLT